MKKTKYFNKKMYEIEKKIKSAFIILVIFLLGLYIGVAINYLEIQNKEEQINELKTEIDDKSQSIDRLIQEKEDLKTILNNYTIEERKEK